MCSGQSLCGDVEVSSSSAAAAAAAAGGKEEDDEEEKRGEQKEGEEEEEEKEEEDEIIVIFANRCGVEGNAVYAGTSAVLGVRSGVITVYGLLGRGQEGLLVADTSGPGSARLVYR